MDNNILILSVGTRNKIVQYFKKALLDDYEEKTGLVIVTDMSNLAPAIYEADKYYIVPKITDNNYLDIILEICKKENIKAILSLIDPELSLLSKNIEKFEGIGVKLIGSSYELCELSLNKMEMYKWLSKNGFKCAKTYDNLNDFYFDLENKKISFPVFVKPMKGSASISINKIYDKEELECIYHKNSSNLIIQEFLDGQEIGADVYIDMISREVVSIFTKKKLLMRSGETDKAVSFKDDKLFSLINEFVAKCGYVGQIDIDIFEIDGEYYFSEVNPRFGGGYPHAYECGVNHMEMILNNLKGIINKSNIGNYKDNIYMMKYSDIFVKI